MSENDPLAGAPSGPLPGPLAGASLQRPLGSAALPESVECPFCAGWETEVFSAFGSALSVSQYYCRNCRTVFEWMKWR